jgi:competence protein ComEC
MAFRSEIVFIRILIPFAGGIIIAYQFPERMLFWWILCFLLLSFNLLLIFNIFYQNFKTYNSKGKLGLLGFSIWFLLGSICCLFQKSFIHQHYFGNERFDQLKGWISNEPQRKNGILSAELTITTGYKNLISRPCSGKLLILMLNDTSGKMDLQYGDQVLIPAKFTLIETTNNPGEFDFKAWLETKKIYNQAFINPHEIIKLKTRNGNSIIEYAINLRRAQVKKYRKLIKNDEAFAVASTLVLGYRSDLSKETLTSYSKTGTIHALSVSGMHVGIIYLFLNWALSFFDRSKLLKIIKLLLICTLIWSYSLLTGFSPSVLRSAVMLSIYILAKAFNKNSNSYNILGFTAFVLLCYDPFLLYDVGFQLSFLAVFGLIYLQPKIYNWVHFKQKWIDKLWSTVALSLAAQITTFPLSIYYFHQFPLYFIFSNLFIIIPLTLMMYLGIAILLLNLHFLGPIFEWIIIFNNDGLKWIASLPFSGINAIWLDIWQLLFLSLALTTLIMALSSHQKKPLIFAFAIFLVLITINTWQKINLLQQRKIIFFSLRQHYATVFISGQEAFLISDLKPAAQAYEFSIRSALEKLQVTIIHHIDFENDTSLNSFIKKNHQIYFHHFPILLLDKDFDHLKIINSVKFKLIWFHQNPQKTISSLKNEVQFERLILDPTNKPYTIKKYLQEAKKYALTPYVLKKNKAYLIDLNL